MGYLSDSSETELLFSFTASQHGTAIQVLS